MCRALSYIGPPLPVAALLHDPDSALVQQSIDPRYLHMLNLAGCGLAAWNRADAEPEEPLIYRSTTVPVYDANLLSLARKVRTTCMLGHVRGVAYRADAGFGPQNVHPFRYPGTRLAFCHNGDLADFSRMKAALQAEVAPRIRSRVGGTTDSEWVYALFLTQLEDPGAWCTEAELLAALEATLGILRRLREAHGIDTSSSLNLFLSDGRQQLALRFTFDFGRYPLDPARMHEANASFLSLWSTIGARFAPDEAGAWAMRGGDGPRAAILASEPLTRDPTGWVEVPEYSAVCITEQDGLLRQRLTNMDA